MKGKVHSKEDIPLVEENQIMEYLNKLDIWCMSPDRMPPQVLRKLRDVITRPLSIIFE